MDDGWYVNLVPGLPLGCAHRLGTRHHGKDVLALCAEPGRAWKPVARNPCLLGVPLCPQCRKEGTGPDQCSTVTLPPPATKTWA